MDSALSEPLDKGKREAEDAVDMGVVSAKKQRVEKMVSEITTDSIEDEEKIEADTSCSERDECLKAKLSAEDGILDSMLEDESKTIEEDMAVTEKKPAVAAEGHISAASKNDESNNETSLDGDFTATIRAPAPLIEDTAAPFKTKYESSTRFDRCPKDETFSDDDVTGAISTYSDCCPKDETFSDDDVTGVILPLPALSIPMSLASDLIKEFDSAHNNDDNVATAMKAPAVPTEKNPIVSWKKRDEFDNDNEIFDEIAAESIPSVLTKKEDETNDELELDDETSSSDDDAQTPATPTEKTTGGKTLFVGNLSFSVEQEDVEDFFKAAGEVVKIRFGMNSDETFKGYGYVEFASAEEAEKAFRELNGKELLRRRVRLDFAKERGTSTPYSGCQYTDTCQKEGKAQGNTVFVRGFNKTDSQDEIKRLLEEHFGSCGEISRVSVPKDQDGSVRGIAFIDFKERDAFNRALALNGSEFREGTLSVKEATSRGDGRDIAGSGRGYGNDVRYSWRDFSGRNVHDTGGGRSNWRGSSGRIGVREAGGGRGDWRDFSGRRGGGGGGRGDWWDFNGRRGAGETSGGRGDWWNFSGRRGVGGRGDWRDFNGRRVGGGRGDWRDTGGRRGVGDAGGGRGGWRDFSGRGVSGAGGGRGGWRDFSGRGIPGTGNWFRAGGWQDSSQKGGSNNYFNGRPFIPGTGVWSGGGGWGQGTPVEPCITAPEGDGPIVPCIAAPKGDGLIELCMAAAKGDVPIEPCIAAPEGDGPIKPCMAAAEGDGSIEPCFAALEGDGNDTSPNDENHAEDPMK